MQFHKNLFIYGWNIFLLSDDSNIKYLANIYTRKMCFQFISCKTVGLFRGIRSLQSLYVHILILRIQQIFQLYIPQGNVLLFYLQRHLGLWLFFPFSSENINFSTTTFIQEIRWNCNAFHFLTAFAAVIYWEERVTCNSWFSQWQQKTHAGWYLFLLYIFLPLT